MIVTSYGAAQEVTGSCHLVDTGHERVLLDCGMFQGGQYIEKKNQEPFPFDPASIDAVVLSHAHFDHTARTPKLVKDGYRGPIYGTHGTLELARLIWLDAAHIMKYEEKKTGGPALYDEADVEAAVSLCQPVGYRTAFQVGEASITLFDAGHIFGSSFIVLHAGNNTIAFSGDMGNDDVPILQETDALPADIDLLLCESTYGDRLHEDSRMRKEILLQEIRDGVARGGTIMMPAFSLERTQEILYMLDELAEEDKTLPQIPIFLDSPLAIDALPTYTQYTQYYDQAAMKKHKTGNDFFAFPQLTITRTVEESKQINDVKGVKMVIAGSGMMSGGRIMHHALRYLSDPHATLILVGYQALGTTGRKILDGASSVRIFQEQVPVRCTVRSIHALSAHGDQEKLLRWMKSGGSYPKAISLVHGDPDAQTQLARLLREQSTSQVYIPAHGEAIEV